MSDPLNQLSALSMAAPANVSITPETPGYLDIEIPDQYKGILQENISLVKELFPFTKDDEKPWALDLLQFLEMYKEIFAHSPGFSTSDGMAMKKFREIYRKAFRGVLYLSSDTLQRVHLTALEEAKKVAEKIPMHKILPATADLEAYIIKEKTWIGRINDFKRNKVVFSIKTDAFETFRESIHEEFPFNPSDEMQFYDHYDMELRFDELRDSAVQDFRSEIPFENDNALLTGFEREFETLLNEKVRNRLLQTNFTNRSKADAFMDSVISDLVQKYKQSINMIQKSPLMEVQKIKELHSNARKDCISRFQEKQLPGDSQFHEDYKSKLEEQIYVSLKECLEKARVAAKVRLWLCEKQSKTEVEECVGKIAAKFADRAAAVGAHIKRMFESELESTIGNLRGTTVASEDKVRFILENAKSERNETPAAATGNLAETDEWFDSAASGADPIPSSPPPASRIPVSTPIVRDYLSLSISSSPPGHSSSASNESKYAYLCRNFFI